MPESTFRGDPYHVLGVSHHASDLDIKRSWRALAREHHPKARANHRLVVGDEDAEAHAR